MTVTGHWGYVDTKTGRRENNRQGGILGEGIALSSFKVTFEQRLERREGSQSISSTRTLQREEMTKWKGKQNPK